MCLTISNKLRWFSAAANGDAILVGKLKNAMKCQVNEEFSDAGQLGLCAIHYSILNDHEKIVQLLLPLEYECVTTRQLKLQNIELGKQSSVLQIAFAVGNPKIIEAILAFAEQRSYTFSLENESLQTPLDVLLQCATKDTCQFLFSDYVIQELEVRRTSFSTKSPFLQAAVYKNFAIFQFITDNFSRLDLWFEQLICDLMKKESNDGTVMDAVKSNFSAQQVEVIDQLMLAIGEFSVKQQTVHKKIEIKGSLKEMFSLKLPNHTNEQPNNDFSFEEEPKDAPRFPAKPMSITSDKKQSNEQNNQEQIAILKQQISNKQKSIKQLQQKSSELRSKVAEGEESTPLPKRTDPKEEENVAQTKEQLELIQNFRKKKEENSAVIQNLMKQLDVFQTIFQQQIHDINLQYSQSNKVAKECNETATKKQHELEMIEKRVIQIHNDVSKRDQIITQNSQLIENLKLTCGKTPLQIKKDKLKEQIIQQNTNFQQQIEKIKKEIEEAKQKKVDGNKQTSEQEREYQVLRLQYSKAMTAKMRTEKDVNQMQLLLSEK